LTSRYRKVEKTKRTPHMNMMAAPVSTRPSFLSTGSFSFFFHFFRHFSLQESPVTYTIGTED